MRRMLLFYVFVRYVMGRFPACGIIFLLVICGFLLWLVTLITRI